MVHVPHRIGVPGSPVSYTYKHAYTVQLKRGWKEGTTLKYPSQQVILQQIGPMRLPPVTLKLQVGKNKRGVCCLKKSLILFPRVETC